MAELTKEDLTEAIAEALARHDIEETELHKEHHRFIKSEIERRARNKERWEKFQSSLIGGLALALLAGLGWLGTLIISWLKHGNPSS